jgi:hypothetical protein
VATSRAAPSTDFSPGSLAPLGKHHLPLVEAPATSRLREKHVACQWSKRGVRFNLQEGRLGVTCVLSTTRRPLLALDLPCAI